MRQKWIAPVPSMPAARRTAPRLESTGTDGTGVATICPVVDTSTVPLMTSTNVTVAGPENAEIHRSSGSTLPGVARKEASVPEMVNFPSSASR